MKKIISVLISTIALFAFAPFIHAQTIEDVIGELTFPQEKGAQVDEGVGFNKSISMPTSDGTYWIKLEAFSTGHASKTMTSTPSDIILVLDSSTSMQQQDYGANDGEYKALPPMSFTYNTFSNTNSYQEPFYGGVSNNVTQLYYKYNDNYYQISRGGNQNNVARYLTFTADGTQYFLNDGLNNGEPSTTAPERTVGPLGNTSTIWTGVLYTTGQMARIDALKNAVTEFIDSIYKNDQEVTTVNPNYPGNRIAIVTYDANAYKLTSNYSWQTADNQRANWFDIGASGVKDNLKNAILGMSLHNYTRPDLGVREAIDDLLDGSPTTKREGANLTVVVFTDGVPAQSGDQGNGNYFNSTIANNTINYGYQIKQDYEGTLFTIGLLDKNSSSEHVKRGIHFLDLLSLNFPESSIQNGGTWTVSGNTITVPGLSNGSEENRESEDYFQLVDENTNLSSIFDAIASQSGGSSDPSLSSATSTVDIVSTSFMLPKNATKDNIKVFTAACTYGDEDTGVYTFATEIQADKRTDTYDIYNSDGELVESGIDVDNAISVTLGTDTDDNPRISVDGFDYGNLWCGPVTLESGDVVYQGYKVIIMIPVQMNPDAVGGPNVATNAPGSGIYINPNDPTPHVTFDSPTVSLPVNVHLEKIGLNPGESARFRIERATIPNKENWDPAIDINEEDWTLVSTVFVTNSPNTPQSKNGYPMVKVRGMPATITIDEDEDGKPDVDSEGKIIQIPVVYRITEEEWAWSYTILDTEEYPNPQYTVTSKVDNPFSFKNEPKEKIDVIVRHAESKATNIFKTVGEGEENVRYDDSNPRKKAEGEGN